MYYTFDISPTCGHVVVSTSSGDRFHITMEELMEGDPRTETSRPALALLKHICQKNNLNTVENMKLALEGKDL